MTSSGIWQDHTASSFRGFDPSRRAGGTGAGIVGLLEELLFGVTNELVLEELVIWEKPEPVASAEGQRSRQNAQRGADPQAFRK